jgi:hypothetical protein
MQMIPQPNKLIDQKWSNLKFSLMLNKNYSASVWVHSYKKKLAGTTKIRIELLLHTAASHGVCSFLV